MTSLDLYPILPELVLGIAAMVLLMFGAIGGNRTIRLVVAIAAASLVVAGYTVTDSPDATLISFGGMIRHDAYIATVKLMILTASFLVLLSAMGHMRFADYQRFEFPVLILLAVTGMLLMVSANHLLVIYMGLELQSLALYVLASFQRANRRSSEAGLKYFVLGALASGMYLYGASLIYGFTGQLGFQGIAQAFQEPGLNIGVSLGLVFVLVAFCFKISAVPFHMWTPDVYEGSPTPVTMFFAVAPKLAAVGLLVRLLMEPFAPFAAQWGQILTIISIATMFVGAFGAMAQSSLKRLLAYSSIGHVGYILAGLAAGTGIAVQGILIYLAVYVPMSVGAFLIVMLMRRGGQSVEQIRDLSGLSASNPALAAAMAVFMFSMAGIPPLAGFFGKWYVFLALVQSGKIILAVAAVLSSVIAAYYYLKVIKAMYFDEAAAPLDIAMTPERRVVLFASAAFTVLFFLVPGIFVEFARRAVESLAL